MDVLWWVLISAAFIVGFVGVVVPIIPSVLLFWVGFLIYHFLVDSTQLGWIFWTSAAVVTVLLFVSDIIANSYFVKRFGGTRQGEYAAIIGVVIGMFVYPPIGIIVVPFLAVLLVEFSISRDTRQAFRASIGSFIAFLSSSIFTFLVFVFLVVWFFVWVFVF